MPIIQFQATNLPRAFILNGLASALIIVLALYIKGRYDTYLDNHGDEVVHDTNFKSISITFLVTFIASIGAYVLMYYTFGYGGGMLAK